MLTDNLIKSFFKVLLLKNYFYKKKEKMIMHLLLKNGYLKRCHFHGDR